jgi:hypothetical protein
MNHTLTAARQVSISDQDLREYVGDAEEEDTLDTLSAYLRQGDAEITGNLLGWAPYTHTLRLGQDADEFSGACFHVTLA